MASKPRAIALLLVFGISCVGVVALPVPAHAASWSEPIIVCANDRDACVERSVPRDVRPDHRQSCGYVSCTVYFNKSETRMAVHSQDAVLLVIVTLTGGSAAPIAGAVALASQVALEHGGCLKIKFGPQYWPGPGGLPLALQWYTDPDDGCD